MLKEWLKKRREKQFAEYVSQMEEEQKEKDATETKRQQEVRAAAIALEEEKKTELRTSSEPWIEVKSGKIVNGAIEFELDWNPAMIEYLKENGFTGDDNQIIQRYLGAIYREMNEDGKNTALDILKQFPGLNNDNSAYVKDDATPVQSDKA